MLQPGVIGSHPRDLIMEEVVIGLEARPEGIGDRFRSEGFFLAEPEVVVGHGLGLGQGSVWVAREVAVSICLHLQDEPWRGRPWEVSMVAS